MRVEYNYDEELKTASCYIYEHDLIFYGVATCHDDDEDMASEKVGCEIAHMRAVIDMLKYRRDCQILPILKEYKHLLSCMKMSKQFNPKSYESKMLQRQIRRLENDLATVRYLLTTERQNLKEYIDTKEEFYKKIRRIRKG